MLYVIEGTTGNIYVGNFTEVPIEDTEENPQNFFFWSEYTLLESDWIWYRKGILSRKTGFWKR